jgi:hypothetical protein
MDDKFAARDGDSGRTYPSEKKNGSDEGVRVTDLPADRLYDPSKESWATRHGLNFESYKRAPGTTGCVSPHPPRAPRPRSRAVARKSRAPTTSMTSRRGCGTALCFSSSAYETALVDTADLKAG